MVSAGLPVITIPGRTSFVTTLPAPIRASSPIFIPGRIVVFAPIFAFLPISHIIISSA